MPALALVNPRVEEAIARFGAIVEADDRFLDAAAAAALEQVEWPLNGELGFLTADCEVAFHRSSLAHLPLALLRRALRLSVAAVGADLDFDQTAAVVERLGSAESGSVTTDGGEVAIEWDFEKVHVRQLKPSEPFRFALTNPGETDSEEFGWRLTAFRRDADASDQKRADFEAIVEPSAINGDLYFRSFQDGDQIEPFGFDGRRKISDLLSENKLTRAAKKRLPIVCDLLGPIWIPGICLSNRVKLKANASNAVCLRFESIRGFPIADGETSNGNQTYAN